jgi:hypothetical protein
VGPLEDVADVGTGQCPSLNVTHAGGGSSIQPQFASGGRFHAGEQSQQRRLAATRCSHYGRDRPFCERGGDPAQRMHSPARCHVHVDQVFAPEDGRINRRHGGLL